MKKFAQKFWPVLGLIAIEAVLFLANFRPGTFLIGWDNLYPELNFGTNLKRGLFSVWQEYRGVGLLDGMAHAANLPHTLFIWFLSLFLPQNLLRYVFIFLMHLMGGLGAYQLLNRKIVKGERAVAFLGALFYLFNLATVQMFYAPFEVFAVHFAFLPWLILYVLEFLASPTRRNLIVFILLSVLAAPQGLVPQVFLAYILLVSLILFVRIVKQGKKALLPAAKVVLVIFATNAFWLLPYAYAAPRVSPTIINAKINQMSSEDVFLKHRARGDLDDAPFLEGFMLDVVEYDKEGKYSKIMEPWAQHIDSVRFKAATAVVFFTVALGFLAFLKRRKAEFIPWAAAAFVAIFFMGSNIPVLDVLNESLRESLPVFGEAFRFSFTKFSILLGLSFTVFFALGVSSLSSFVQKGAKALLGVIFSVFLISLFVYAQPAFTGSFLFDELRLEAPVEYFRTIEFFKHQNKNTRVALLPQPNFWSWRYRNWGYRGSGFLWYGIEQPILDRAFDPWSSQSENFYWELTYALYSQDLPLLEKVLEKYQVNWIIVDRRLMNLPSPKALYYEETEKLLFDSNKIKLTQDFGGVRIYRVNLDAQAQNYVMLAQDLPTVGPSYNYNNHDRAYFEKGNYVVSREPDAFYPFLSLFTGKEQDDIEFEVKENKDFYIFRAGLPENIEEYTLRVPRPEEHAVAWINPGKLSEVRYFIPEVRQNNEFLEVVVPRVYGYLGAELYPYRDPSLAEGKNCNLRKQGSVKNTVMREGEKRFLRVASTDADNCSLAFWLPNLTQSMGYLITVEARNVKGKSLVFWLENFNVRKPDIETNLPKREPFRAPEFTVSYFVQPPMEEDGLGYTVHLDNVSIGSQESVNDVTKVTVSPIPYEFLKRLVFEKNREVLPTVNSNIKVSHPNPSLYEVTTVSPSTGSLTLMLSQAYHQGWQAYYLNSGTPSFLAPVVGKRAGEHVLVNNWANGWRLGEQPEGEKLVILFVPQYLEYTGLALLGIIIGYMLMRRFV